MSKLIFVTGGVVSGIGKGILAASIGALIKGRGYRVSMIKCDPYLNVDAGTMSPYQHGEVFVLKDGAETDLDLGHYERFIDEDLDQLANVTSGRIYSAVITKERRGEYLGATVQMIPHVTNEIMDAIKGALEHSKAEILVVEIGGTVGDIEGLPFLEAIRQLRRSFPPEDLLYVHTTLVPFLETSQEAKTKPTQHSVAELRSIGIQPNVVVCRSRRAISRKLREKVALFCDVDQEQVISLPDLNSIYRVPLYLQREGFSAILDRFLGERRTADLAIWERLERIIESPHPQLRVGVVGKYVGMRDTYISVNEALTHASLEEELDLQLVWIPSEKLEGKDLSGILGELDGIVVPGGFDPRGVEGKIAAVEYARCQGIPYFGLCLGLQCAVIEFARHVCGLEAANSTECDPFTPYPVIDLLADQRGLEAKGGTMRLGVYPCSVQEGSEAWRAYGQDIVWERHRHRYELNNEYLHLLERGGLVVSGRYEELGLAEIVELPGHPWFLGTQFHPELTSRPGKPNPLFHQFIRACARRASLRWKN
ncbi:MAG: CTP synthase [Coprothermobacterota bacterium]|nr:CTP synthase [Coprothermobacterota bacterium]